MLNEDAPYGDLTTSSLGIDTKPALLAFASRKLPIMASCIEEAAALCRLNSLDVKSYQKSGTIIDSNTVFLEAHGEAKDIHNIYKTIQNLLDYACGVATYTHHMVNAAKSVNPQISVATTRKMIPLTKKIAVKSVFFGGGIIHRLGLSESILIFDTHRVFFQNDLQLADAIRQAKISNPEKKIVIEAISEQEAVKFADIGADILQLEKFPLERLSETVAHLRAKYPGTKLLATGGIHIDNVIAYAQSGVDAIVTSAPYYANPADIKVRVEPL